MQPLAWTVAVYLGVGLITFVILGVDKRRARRGLRRVSERTLHGFELGGGWLGSLVGQHTFRHKRRKLSYQVVFWLIGLGHGGFWMWWWLWGQILISD